MLTGSQTAKRRQTIGVRLGYRHRTPLKLNRHLRSFNRLTFECDNASRQQAPSSQTHILNSHR
jgi:hypothetical protein